MNLYLFQNLPLRFIPPKQVWAPPIHVDMGVHGFWNRHRFHFKDYYQNIKLPYPLSGRGACRERCVLR